MPIKGVSEVRRLPRLDSVEATRRVRTELPETAVSILTACEDEGYIVGLLGAGASGYLLKSTRGEELVQGIRFVQAGESNSAIGKPQ